MQTGEKGKSYGLIKPNVGKANNVLKPSVFARDDDDDEDQDVNAQLREVSKKKQKQVLISALLSQLSLTLPNTSYTIPKLLLAPTSSLALHNPPKHARGFQIRKSSYFPQPPPHHTLPSHSLPQNIYQFLTLHTIIGRCRSRTTKKRGSHSI